jgi:tetratricopeptide (TPR) repeat protein
MLTHEPGLGFDKCREGTRGHSLAGKGHASNPLDQKFQSICRHQIGRAYVIMERYEEAIAEFEKALRLIPNNWADFLWLSAAYVFAGHEEEARTNAERLLRVSPKFSLNAFANRVTYKDQAFKERLMVALRKAGLK